MFDLPPRSHVHLCPTESEEGRLEQTTPEIDPRMDRRQPNVERHAGNGKATQYSPVPA